MPVVPLLKNITWPYLTSGKAAACFLPTFASK